MTPDKVSEFARAAAEYIRRSLGVELGASEETLAYADHYLAEARRSGPVKREIVDLLAPAFGAYFGQILLARFAGDWQAEDADPTRWTITLRSPEGETLLTLHPVGIAAEVVASSEVEGHDASLAPPAAYEERLAEALAATRPVEADYFYSLTGRFETIVHAADLLMAMRMDSKES